MKADIVVFPVASFAMQITVVGPKGKRLPEGDTPSRLGRDLRP